MHIKKIISGLSALVLGIQTLGLNTIVTAIGESSANDGNNLVEITLNELGTQVDLKIQVNGSDNYSKLYNYNDLSLNSNGNKVFYVPNMTDYQVTFIDAKGTEAINDDSVISIIKNLDNYSSLRGKYKLDGVYQSYELTFNPITENRQASVSLDTYVNGDINLDGQLRSNDLLILKQRLLFEYNIIQTGAYEQGETGGNVSISGKNNTYANNLTINGDLFADNSIYLGFDSGNINGKLSTSNGKSGNDIFNINVNNENVSIADTENSSITLEGSNTNEFYLNYRSNMTYFDLNEDILLTDEDVNSLYFSNDIQVEEVTEITEQNLNINDDRSFANDITFNTPNSMNLNASIKAEGDITINGEVHNSNNAIIYSKQNITISNDSTFSFTGMIYAPNGTVTINANNVNINGCVIAKNIIINANTVNFNVNSLTKYENDNTSKVLTDLQLFLADMNDDGIADDKDLIIMKRILLHLDPNDVDETVDTDDDGLPDYLEEYFGTNKNKADTDKDGLSDYEEIFILGTDPLSKDTDNNGVHDGNEDADEDGLTNLQELEYGTSMICADTDNDGLSDYDEIFKYYTNPILYDTDNDTLSDGDEVKLNLSPTNIITDGVTEDATRIITQELSENQIDSELLDGNNLLIPSLSANVSGVIDDKISLKYNHIDAFNENSAIIGKAVYINSSCTEDCNMILKYNYSSLISYYNEKDLENLVICKYDDGDIIPFDTIIDSENNNICANITNGGTYIVIDICRFFEGFDITSQNLLQNKEVEELNQTEELTIGSSNIMPLRFYTVTNDGTNDNINISISGKNVNGQADIVFVIDNSSSMNDTISNVKSNINTFVDNLNSSGVNCRFGLVVFSDNTNNEETYAIKNKNSFWFYDNDIENYKNQINQIPIRNGGDLEETSVEGLEMARRFPFRTGSNKFIILITDNSYKINNKYGISSINDMKERLSSSNICTSVITKLSYYDVYKSIYNSTDGIVANISEDFDKELFKISEKVKEKTNDGSWVILNDYQYIKLDDEVSYSNGVDTDKDGVTDYTELGELKTYNLSLLARMYLEKLGIPIEKLSSATIEMYDYNSNPILTDTDYDGRNDNIDDLPKDNSFNGTLNTFKIDGNFDYSANVYYNVDYRVFFNETNSLAFVPASEKYNQQLCTLSSIYSSLAYHTKGLYVDDEDFIDNYWFNSDAKDNLKEIMEFYGFNDVKYYYLGSSNDDASNYDNMNILNYEDSDISEVCFGSREVTYNGETKTIVAVFIRGTNGTIKEWSSNFDIGSTEELFAYNQWKNTQSIEYFDNHLNYLLTNNSIELNSFNDWKTEENHKGFDVAANRILKELEIYVSNKKNVTYWVTGHSRGAAIANILGAYLYDSNKEAFVYTFASPNTTTKDDYNSSKYNFIFNIINKEDFVPMLPMNQWGFNRYGIIKESSINDNCIDIWNNLTGLKYKSNYNSAIYAVNKMTNIIPLDGNRNDCYMYTCNCHGDGTDNSITVITQSYNFVNNLKYVLSQKAPTASQYCQYEEYIGANTMCQSPEYFMQCLASLMSINTSTFTVSATSIFNVLSISNKYKPLEGAICLAYIGGISTPHFTETYYLLSKEVK